MHTCAAYASYVFESRGVFERRQYCVIDHYKGKTNIPLQNAKRGVRESVLLGTVDRGGEGDCQQKPPGKRVGTLSRGTVCFVRATLPLGIGRVGRK